MGLVYKARHLSLNRVVALKLLLPGPFSSPEMLSRFRREAQAAAALSHPGIVPVYEVGELDGQSFFSMEYVEGRSLSQVIEECGLRIADFNQVGRWIQGIAEAIEHAHAHGIVHRDLKPANILLDPEDRIRVADFGLAKRFSSDSSLATDTSSLTLTGQVLGSPDYLAPEQASGRNAPSQPASDIYAMGAILYELLTGRPPFRSSSIQDTLLRIRDSEPVAPRLLNGSVPRDLEVICLKCLEKDPVRRYATARELADELERFLKGEPIRARPIGTVGKTWRWCRRKPVLAVMTAAIATLLLTVTAVSVVSAWRIATARKGEQREAYYSNIALANQYIEQGSIDRALETLWKCPEQYRHWEWGHLLYLCHQEAASFQAHATNVTATFFSPDSKWVVSQDAAGLAKVWDWEAEQQVFGFGSSSNRAGWIAFHPSGGQLAAAMGTNGVWIWSTTNWASSPVGTRSTASPTSSGTEWNPSLPGSANATRSETNGLLFTLHPQRSEVTTLAYSRDGQRLVTGGADGAVAVWDSATGHQLSRQETTNQPIRRVAISPDGQRLVAVAERSAWVWELQSGKLIRAFPDVLVAADVSRRTSPSQEVSADSRPRLREEEGSTLPAPQETRTSRPTNRITAVFTDDTGKNFATIDSEDRLTLWREGRAPQHLITIHGRLPLPLRRVFFSPDGRWMANAGDENTARVWDVATGTERLAIAERVLGVAFSRDGSRMVTRHSEYWVTTWDLAQGRRLKVLRGHSTVANAVGLSANGRLAASADDSGIVKVWSAEPGRELAQDRAWQWACTYSPDGRLIANCAFHEGVIIRSVRSGRELLRIHPPNESFFEAAFSPDSRRLVTVGSHKTAKVWDVETGKLLLRLRGHRRQVAFGVAYSPDGRWIAAGGLDATVKLWDAQTGKERLTLPVDPQHGYALLGISNRVTWVTFDAKGERLLGGTGDGKIRIWEVPTGTLLAALATGESGAIATARFLPDPRRLITTAGKRIQVWDLGTGRLVTEAKGRGYTGGFDVTSDGRRMITACWEIVDDFGNGTLEIWDVEATPRRILNLPGHQLFIWAEFSPDDRTVARCSVDYCVYRWETFPWRKGEYPEARSQTAEDGLSAEARRAKAEGQRSGIRIQAGFAERVRQYARRYWRERLNWELKGAEGEAVEPRVVQVPLDRTLFAKRDPLAAVNQLDLTDFYTGELGETFCGKAGTTYDHDDDLSELPVGLVKLGGVAFDIRGVIQVRRTEPLGGPWELAASDDAVRVDGISIHQEAARLHLLLGTARSEADGTVVGRLLLRYADGETRSLDLVYGRDVRDWWYDPAKADAETTDRAKVVWTGINPVANEYGRRLRLYLNTRENPRPGVKITNFDFVSAMSESAPFLIAVTVE